jgi:hypothetical protein
MSNTCLGLAARPTPTRLWKRARSRWRILRGRGGWCLRARSCPVWTAIRCLSLRDGKRSLCPCRLRRRSAQTLLIATGSEVSIAIEAHNQLTREGVASRVVSMPCWDLVLVPPGRTVNFHGEERRNDSHQSTTGPEALLARKGPGKEAKLCYAGTIMLTVHTGPRVGGCR